MSIDAPSIQTLEKIKKALRANLKLAPDSPIADDMPLIGGSMDLDSLDVLLLITSIEKEMGRKISTEQMDKSAFRSVSTLGLFIDKAVLGAKGDGQ